MTPSKALLRFSLVLTFALALCQSATLADEVNRRQLFANNVKGCVGVMTAGGPASGWVVDVEKRWIVTCQHVVGAKEEVDIVFPDFKDGRLIQERSYYLKTATKVKAKILSADTKCDLCLIQADTIPPGTVALRLAEDSGHPGDNLNLIGNPAASGAMWNFSTGTLRAVYKKKFTYKNTTHDVEALVGETQLPANPGDSGGAVFNDKGEVLGVHSGGSPDGIQLMATYIDVAEVRLLLREPFKGVAKLSAFDEFYSKANELFNRNEVDKALESYSQAIKLKPDYSEAWRSRATANIRKKLWDSAMEDCNEAIRLNKANAKAYNERAVCHGAKGNLTAALADYNEAIRLTGTEPMYWAGRAWTFNGLQDYHSAISDANEAIRLKSEFALPFHERGVARFWLKEYDKALVDFNQAIKLQANNFEYYYFRGVTLVIQKQSAAALKDFNDSIRLNPNYALAFKERGTLHFNNKDYPLALKDYTDALALDGKDAQVWLWRSWCHRDMGNAQQAAADYNEAVRLNPTLVTAEDMAGRGRKQ